MSRGHFSAMVRLIELLIERGPMTRLQIEQAMNHSRSYVSALLNRTHKRLALIHISGWSYTNPTREPAPVYAPFPGDDVPKPPRLTTREVLRRSRVRRARDRQRAAVPTSVFDIAMSGRKRAAMLRERANSL